MPPGTRPNPRHSAARNVNSFKKDRSPSPSTSPQVQLITSDQLNVPTDAKEAYAFALMAYETFHHRPSNLPSATGANHPAILGKISYAPPK